MKTELNQREHISDQQKREIKELKHTINLLNSGKDYTMYQNSIGNFEGGIQNSAGRKSSSATKRRNAATPQQLKSKTPGRSGRTIENGNEVRTSNLSAQMRAVQRTP